MRTYAGALSQIGDQTVQIKPSRGGTDDSDAVVRTVVKGKSEPIQLDYRLEKTNGGWKVYDVNVLGVWLASSTAAPTSTRWARLPRSACAEIQ